MRERYQILSLLTLTLALFLPVLASGLFILDDLQLATAARSMADQPLADLFGRRGGLYYRPLLALSFVLDARFWDMHPGILHLENILIHALNAMLVFAIVRQLARSRPQSQSWLPWLAGVVFVAHPLTTESVNWISGRSDLLATLFGLTAVWLFLLAGGRRIFWAWWAAAGLALLGSLAKEVAFFLLPTLALWLWLIRTPPQATTRTDRIMATLPFVLAMLAYGLLRSGALAQVDRGVARIGAGVTTPEPLTSALQQIVAAYGFYWKKLLVPLPLNFAIVEIDPAYLWMGIFAVLLVTLCLLRRDPLAGLLLAISLTVLPALLNAVVEFAWTPYAERYLYLPVALLSIGFALPSVPGGGRVRLRCGLLACLMILCLPVTLQRNLVWADPLELLTRTHRQSPTHIDLWNIYAVELADDERYRQARQEFNRLLEVHPDHQLAYRNLAAMEMYIDQPQAARRVLEPFFAGQLEPSEATLDVMIDVNTARLKAIRSPDQEAEVRDELLDSYRRRSAARRE